MALKEQYFTVSEAATYLGVTRQTISRWIKKGRFRAERFGREILIDKVSLDNYRFNYRDRIIGNKILQNFTDLVRKKCGYSKDDRIEMILDELYEPGRSMNYIVTKKDGNIDKIYLTINYERTKDGLKSAGGKITREQYKRIPDDDNEPIENE
jgi:excisionase family DNA binding protein